MEVDRMNVARVHRRQLVAFARGVGSGKIHAQVVPEHEANDREPKWTLRPDADANDDRGLGIESGERASRGVEYLDAKNFRPAVAKALVDVRQAPGDLW